MQFKILYLLIYSQPFAVCFCASGKVSSYLICLWVIPVPWPAGEKSFFTKVEYLLCFQELISLVRNNMMILWKKSDYPSYPALLENTVSLYLILPNNKDLFLEIFTEGSLVFTLLISILIFKNAQFKSSLLGHAVS